MVKHSVRREHPRQARLRKREELTATGTVRLTFDMVDLAPLEAEPGQFIGISVPIKGARRAKTPYCIMACSPDQHSFELLVRVVADGPVSIVLGTMAAGTVIDFRGPLGCRMFPEEPDLDIVLMATGVGISPFLFLVDELAKAGHDRSVRLFWGLRLTDDICLQEELENLVKRHHHFSWEVTLSQPPSNWEGMRGRITHSVPPLLECEQDQLFYYCGNGAMAEDMMAALGQVGVSQRWMHNEPFFNRRYKPTPEVIADIVSRFPPDVRRRAVPTNPADLFPVDHPLNG